MAYQDFDTYTEVDQETDIAVDGTEITVTTMTGAVISYVYRDFGADYFSGSFQVRMKVHIPSGSADGVSLCLGAFTNTLDDPWTLDQASDDYLAIRVKNVATVLTLYAEECNAGTLTTSAGEDITALDDTDLWVIIERDETVGTYGEFRVFVYTDDEHVTQVAYEAVTLTEKEDFRYFMPVSSYQDSSAASISATIDECYVGHSDVIAFNRGSIYTSGTSVTVEYIEQNKGMFAKTASGRWYGFLHYYTSNHYSWWVYSDDDGATWSGPYKWGGPTSTAPYGHTVVASGSSHLDDVIASFSYAASDLILTHSVEGQSITGYFSPTQAVDGESSWHQLLNDKDTDETFLIWPEVVGGYSGFTVAYAEGGGASFTTGEFVQAANVAVGNGPSSSGAIKSLLTKSGDYAYIIYRCYLGQSNFDGLRIARYTVATHTVGTPQVLVSSRAEFSFNQLQATIDLDDNIHICWGDNQNSGVTYMRVSDDGDDTFTTEYGPVNLMAIDSEILEPMGIAVNQAGELYVGVGRGDDEGVYVRKSTDNGETWMTVGAYAASAIAIQGPYQDPNRAHTYLDSGCPPFLLMDEADDDYDWITDPAQGDYLTAFPDDTSENLDGGNWGRKVALTIDKTYIGEALSHFPVILSKTVLPGEMFLLSGEYAALEGGGDIRVSLDADGDQRIACDVREFHIAADTGDAYANICVSYSGELPTGEDTTIYVWYNNPSAGVVQAGEAYGAKNVYDENFVAVFPLHETASGTGAFRDRTRNGNAFTTYNMDVSNKQTGVISHGQTFNGTNEKAILISGNNYDSKWLNYSFPYTISYIGQRDPAGTDIQSLIAQCRDDSYDHALMVRVNSAGTILAWYDSGANTNATTSEALETGEYGWVSGVFSSTTSRFAQLNATNRVENTTSLAHPTSDPVDNFFVLGNLERAADAFEQGPIEELRVSDSVRSQNWTNAEYYNIFEPLNFFTIGTAEDAGPASDALRRHMCNLMCS